MGTWPGIAAPLAIVLTALSPPQARAQDSGGDLALPVRRDLSARLSPEALKPLEPVPTTHPLRTRLPDPLRLRALSANFHPYPDAALIDNSGLLEAPAGQRGHVTVSPQGRLIFEDGTPARFWGVTITQEHIDIPKSRIEEVVDVLARAGCNMVRFHSLDNRAGEAFGFTRRTIIEETAPHTQDFDPEYLDRLHYWMARLKQRGIYSYIVLRAFRHYRPGDQVPAAEALPRGAKPYAFFNQRLIELQKRFARALLVETVNPYTGLTPAADPSVALVELFNEDSLFTKGDAWNKLLEPYAAEFKALWNKHLIERHGSDARLDKIWRGADGTGGLAPGESAEKGTVALPLLPPTESLVSAAAATTDPLRSPLRRRDAIEFAARLQQRYFENLRDDLRNAGVRAPLTGVVSGAIPADTRTVAQHLDFTAENAYFDHPAYEPGLEWNGVPFFRNAPLASANSGAQWIPHVTRYHWAGRPLAIREWTACWPNASRGAQMPEMAAYARFQGWDCVLAFAFFTTTELNRLSPFAIQNDPLRWGLFAHAARIFLSEDSIEPARHTVAVAWTPEDLAAWGQSTDPIHTLAYQHRIVQQDAQPESAGTHNGTSPTLTIVAGRSHDSAYSGRNLLIHSPVAPPKVADGSLWSRSGYEKLALSSGQANGAQFELPGPVLTDPVTTFVQLATGFTRESLLASGLQPHAPAPDGGNYALGGVDSSRRNVILGRTPQPSCQGLPQSSCACGTRLRPLSRTSTRGFESPTRAN